MNFPSFWQYNPLTKDYELSLTNKNRTVVASHLLEDYCFSLVVRDSQGEPVSMLVLTPEGDVDASGDLEEIATNRAVLLGGKDLPEVDKGYLRKMLELVS